MNQKSLIVLAAVAVLAAILALVGQQANHGSGSTAALVGTELLPGLAADLNEVEQISVVQPGNEEAVTLRKTDGIWTVAQQDDYPADVARLRDALLALAEARVVEEKTSNAEFYDRLGVGAIENESAGGIGVRISVGGKSYPDVILGTTSGSNSRFVRRAEEATSLLVDRNPSIPADPTQWLAPELLDVRSDHVQRVEISHRDGERIVIAKPAREERNFVVENIPADRELQYATVANVTGNALRELRLQRARAAATDVAPAFTTEFWTFDGLVVTATGSEDNGERWVTFTARFEPDQALDFATAGADEGVDVPPAEGEDAAAQAEQINSRLSGWQFTIPSHIYDQMARRMENLLKPLDEPASE